MNTKDSTASAPTTSSTPTMTSAKIPSPNQSEHLLKSKERSEGTSPISSSSPILRRPSNSSSPAHSPTSPSLAASPLSLSPNLSGPSISVQSMSENSSDLPSTPPSDPTTSANSSGSSSPTKESNDHSKFVLCSNYLQPCKQTTNNQSSQFIKTLPSPSTFLCSQPNVLLCSE